MKATIQLHATTSGGEIRPPDVSIKEDADVPAHPRLGFARSFLQHIIADHYPALHIGDQYKENTLNFTFTLLHVHITLSGGYTGEKTVIVTGTLLD